MPPISASSSCQKFECLGHSLQWIISKKSVTAGMSHMLDDFFFIGPKDLSKCQVELDRFLTICDISGIPIKSDIFSLPQLFRQYKELKLIPILWFSRGQVN